MRAGKSFKSSSMKVVFHISPFVDTSFPLILNIQHFHCTDHLSSLAPYCAPKCCSYSQSQSPSAALPQPRGHHLYQVNLPRTLSTMSTESYDLNATIAAFNNRLNDLVTATTARMNVLEAIVHAQQVQIDQLIAENKLLPSQKSRGNCLYPFFPYCDV